jgi:16S rRNA (guanine(966)-N(2))-methyltransferase RsmD
MRIIAGEHRGRRIESPPGLETRPMLDRVREAMFSTLGKRAEGANVLDLFAGSGSLGLEALSRGARRARMVEKHPLALSVLRKNVELLGMGERAEIVRGDALRPDLWRPLGGSPAFDLVFLDPPYRRIEEPDPRTEVLARIGDLLRDVVAPGGCLVVHVPARALDWIRVPGLVLAPERRDERRYGSSGLLYLFSEKASGG